jgi:hypothetical protein
MNLTTHWILAVALGVALFHSGQIALILGIGALIPDLDREYYLTVKNIIGKYQLHRALLHNVVFMALLYFVNPFLALGAFSHSVVDIFTTASDRGVEIFYPFTRIVRSYHLTIEGKPSSKPGNKLAWWVEDPWRLLKQTTDFDLQEPSEQAWRRSYGPFKNSRIVDWGLFFGSIFFLALCFFFSRSEFFPTLTFDDGLIVPMVGIAFFYVIGEVWRRKRINVNRLRNKYIVVAALIVGLIIFVFGISRYVLEIPTATNLTIPIYGVVSMILGLIAAFMFVRFRPKRTDLSA